MVVVVFVAVVVINIVAFEDNIVDILALTRLQGIFTRWTSVFVLVICNGKQTKLYNSMILTQFSNLSFSITAKPSALWSITVKNTD